MISGPSLTSVSTGNPSRIRSAKPEWEKLQGRFIKSLSTENEEEKSITSPSSLPPFGYHKVTKEGEKIFSFGSDITGSPDNFVCRQRYLRSYVFTREEESNNDNNTSVLKKAKRWFEVKEKGKGKAKDKSELTNLCSSFDTCLKFLLRCIANTA